MQRFRWLVLAAVLMSTSTALAFEHTKTLPQGVRNFNLRSAMSRFDTETDRSGDTKPLAEPLAKEMTFNDVARAESALKGKKLRAFLKANGFRTDESLGKYRADMNGQVSVVAPVFSYGITENFSMALGVPFYRAQTSVDMGFAIHDRARDFVGALTHPRNNQPGSAQEAVTKLNDAVGYLNDKLVEHGYQPLEDWEDQGLGDVTLGGKFRFFESPRLAAATSAGVVAPTGRTDDPDILHDIPFGDGQWDVFGQLAVDEPVLGDELFLNQYAKYTAQLAGEKTVRLATDERPIDVPKEQVRFKLGDKVDAGTSVQYKPSYGLVTGLGYVFTRKYGDDYHGVDDEVGRELEEGTDQTKHSGEAMLGYSTVPAFRSGSFSYPVSVTVSLLRQFESRNAPVADLAQMDFNVYF